MSNKAGSFSFAVTGGLVTAVFLIIAFTVSIIVIVALIKKSRKTTKETIEKSV